MSQKNWPWYRWARFLALLVAVAGVSGFVGWCLGSPSTVYSAPPATTPLPDQTVSVTVPDNMLTPAQIATPDNADKVAPNQPIRVVIPGAAIEKLAPPHELWLRSGAPSRTATWGPPVSAILVSFVALGGAMWAANKSAATALATAANDRQSDARSEWFRRFKEMLDLALAKDDDARSTVGIKMLALHVKSELAGDEEKNLAETVYTDILKAKLDYVIKMLDAAAKTGDDVHVVVVDNPPKDS